MKKLWLVAVIIAFVGVGFAVAAEHPTNDIAASESQDAEKKGSGSEEAVADSSASEHPTSEHPASEHPSSEHPK